MKAERFFVKLLIYISSFSSRYLILLKNCNKNTTLNFFVVAEMDQKVQLSTSINCMAIVGPCAPKLHLEIQQCICISLGSQTIQAYFINSVCQPCLKLFLELAPLYRQCSHLKVKTTCPGLTIECQMEPHHFLSSYPFTISILPLHFRLCTLLFSLTAFFFISSFAVKVFFYRYHFYAQSYLQHAIRMAKLI